MEGTIFPNRPVPSIPTKPSKPNPPLKFSSTTLPLPPQSPPSIPLESLIQHLHHLSLPPNKSSSSSLHISAASTTQKRSNFKKHTLVFDGKEYEGGVSNHGSFEFLSKEGKLMCNSIVGYPLNSLNELFDNSKHELLEVDLVSVLKALDVSGNRERALLLFEWLVVNASFANGKLVKEVIQLMVRILGKESQHSISLKLLDMIPLEEYSLDVRAYTSILHADYRTGKFDKAISLFEKVKEKELPPTLVTYNVMLDVYGKNGQS